MSSSVPFIETDEGTEDYSSLLSLTVRASNHFKVSASVLLIETGESVGDYSSLLSLTIRAYKPL